MEWVVVVRVACVSGLKLIISNMTLDNTYIIDFEAFSINLNSLICAVCRLTQLVCALGQ
jgi:hypothetical protein